MELRQLRYFVALAEELHFGRAAEREHVAQSALSQQLRQLERELGALLLERSTHHVEVTAAGRALLAEARQILVRVERTAAAVRQAGHDTPTLRVGVLDASYDSMPLILGELQARHPELEVHQVEAGLPQQYACLMDGRLDVGCGRASLAPAEIASALFRVDRMGVLVHAEHVLAGRESILVGMLGDEPMLLPEERRAPEFTRLVIELCRSAGVTPTLYRGTVQSVRGAISLVARGQCVACVPASCTPTPPGTIWRPLSQPRVGYPWSVLWRAGNRSPYVEAVVACAQSVAGRLGWLAVSDPDKPAPLAGSHHPGDDNLPGTR
jgi:DNA-binding transcriptional LysR family regulator